MGDRRLSIKGENNTTDFFAIFVQKGKYRETAIIQCKNDLSSSWVSLPFIITEEQIHDVVMIIENTINQINKNAGSN